VSAVPGSRSGRCSSHPAMHCLFRPAIRCPYLAISIGAGCGACHCTCALLTALSAHVDIDVRHECIWRCCQHRPYLCQRKLDERPFEFRHRRRRRLVCKLSGFTSGMQRNRTVVVWPVLRTPTRHVRQHRACARARKGSAVVLMTVIRTAAASAAPTAPMFSTSSAAIRSSRQRPSVKQHASRSIAFSCASPVWLRCDSNRFTHTGTPILWACAGAAGVQCVLYRQRHPVFQLFRQR
jgi:hypothetical protein